MAAGAVCTLPVSGRAIPVNSCSLVTCRTCKAKRRQRAPGHERLSAAFRWEFPKLGGTLFWGPYNKDPIILLYMRVI